MNIRRSTQGLRHKRLQIIEARNKMGEIKVLELMQARIEYYKEEIAIREGVLELMNTEREFEKLLGINMGDLERLSASVHSDADVFKMSGRF